LELLDSNGDFKQCIISNKEIQTNEFTQGDATYASTLCFA